jgi:hypothetical protein
MRGMPSILLPFLLATTLAAAGTRVCVTAEHTNLRYQNADNVEVACVVAKGQELIVRGPLEGNWLPVIPPDDVSVWVYAELVRKGAIIRDKTQLRSGPGLNFRVVGSLNHGIPVESRGRLGDWLKIKPPESFPLWVSRTAIAVAPTSAVPDTLNLSPAMASGLLSALADDPAAGTITNDAAEAATAVHVLLPAQRESNTVVRVPLPVELVYLPLAASPLQGHRVRITGAVRASVPGTTLTSNVACRISGPDRSGGIVTFCHVLAPAPRLATLPAGTRVTIEGPAWWLKGEPVPVVQAETVKTDVF